MKKIMISTLLFVLCACQRTPAVLHIYTWADYIKPELVSQFEANNKCKVQIDTFDSNEAMYAKLKAGASGYDLITPSSYMVKVMSDQGMLRKLDRTLIPNVANVDPNFLKLAIDREMEHSVPYMITYTGIGYLKDRISDVKPSWASLARPEVKHRMTMLNDMRETIGAALKYLGYSLNTTDDAQLAEAKAVLLSWKEQLTKFESEQYKTGLASAEFFMVHGYSGDILQAQEESEQVEFVIPEEGYSLACDDLVIPAKAEQVELAHRFINFLHQPAIAAANTEFISYLCPNFKSYELLSEETRANPGIFPAPELLAKGEIIRDLGEHNKKYSQIWDELK